MELTLTRLTCQDTQVAVICDCQHSHAFDLRTLLPQPGNELAHSPDAPVIYGKAVYVALFPSGSLARQVFDEERKKMPGRILLVTTDNDLDSIPWEYAHGPEDASDFLMVECHVVRGLPTDQCMDPPTLETGSLLFLLFWMGKHLRYLKIIYIPRP